MDWRYFFVLGGLTFCHAVSAYDLLLNVKGTISNNGCMVSADSQMLNVVFGNVAQKQFYAKDVAFAKLQFVIKLEHCGSETTGVKVTFEGPPHPDNPDLLALNETPGLDFATGLGIEILDATGIKLPIGIQIPSTLPIDAAPGAVNELVFYAQYRSTGPVTLGIADAISTFVLEYQ